MGALITRS